MKKYLLGLLAFFMMSTSAMAYNWPDRTAQVHLFEWKHSDVALECENVLGPLGYAAVQVSPVQEHRVIGSENPFGQAYPWWQRYQPIGVSVENTRSGSRAEFQDMVNRCAAVGVDVYVDVVLNHTTGDPAQTGGTCIGSDGTTCGYKSVTGLYSAADFHNDCSIDWNNAWTVQNCWLSGLQDLKTESSYVQGKLRDYMTDLNNLGVNGIRVDAAKHIHKDQLNYILAPFNGYIFQEVIVDAAAPASNYTWIGDITEFKWGHEIKNAFQNGGQLGWLNNNGGIGSSNWGFISGTEAVVFVENHDDERNGAGLTYKDGANYALANVFTLAHEYGYSKVMSSYEFTDTSAGPPGSNGVTSNVWTSNTTDVCGQGGWVCQHRWPAMAGMVGFRNHVVGEPVLDFWEHSQNHISFRRGTKGFVTINREGYTRNFNLYTGLPDGEYCDVANDVFDYDNGTCSGGTYTVAGGYLNSSVWANGAIAIHIGSQVSAAGGGNANVNFTCANGNTYWGQNVYVVGNVAELGNWTISNAADQKLDPNNYPTWNKSISVPANTTIEWKCVKSANGSTIQQWEGGSNNSVTSGNSGTTVNSTGGSF